MAENETTTTEILEFLQEHMLTKEEGRDFATKEDLKGFATKEDVKACATKEDLKGFATKEDLGKMQHQILDGVDRKLADLKGDLVVLMRDEDHKVDELIKVLQKKSVLDEHESERLLKLRPFPQPAI